MFSLARPSRKIADASGRAGASYRGVAAPRRLRTVDHYYSLSISLRCEHEQSPCDIGDPGSGRRPGRSGKSNDSKNCAGADHPRASDRVVEGVFDDYQLDNEQSRWLPRALRNRALWYRSKQPDRDRQISDQVEPGSLIDGFPRTP